LLLASAAVWAGPKFHVTLDAAAAPAGVSGRLLILLEKGSAVKPTIRLGFAPGQSMLASRPVDFAAPGTVIEIDADEIAFPKPFSELEPGDYIAMAVFDPDNSFPRNRQDAGDWVSDVAVLRKGWPGAGPPAELRLTRRLPAPPKPADTAAVKLVEFPSPALAAFWGREVIMRAGVVLPPDWETNAAPLPAVYHVHGFGGDHTGAWRAGERIAREMGEGKRMRAAHVFLDASCPGGHHVFADSDNNGPWGKALTEDFIPYLERRFRLAPTPKGRFLTGHSSGGWSTLWLQVRYPDYFGGTWPTAPDSVDFRNWTGIDMTPGSTQNAYVKADGTPLNLVRARGRDIVSFRDFMHMEMVAGEMGGQIASFDWVFSPRGPDGRPLRGFHRQTGVPDQKVLEAWKRYDIARIVRENWETLGPKLKGKVRLVIGDEDTFHLNESAELFCAFLKSKGREEACEIVPGRNHSDLFQAYKTYPQGLEKRIDEEMKAAWTAQVP
jgi:hypothetical protein